DVVNELKNIISLNDDAINEFILMQNIQYGLYDNKEVFVNEKNIDEVVFCSCCGKIKLSSDIQSELGEWFCSDECKKTEKYCIELANNIHNSDEFKQKQADFDRSITALAATTIPSANAWNKNFRAIQTGENYQQYTKANGTNSSGKPIDKNGNPIVSTGHGDAAEIMNNELDNLHGKNAKIVGGDNVPNGADRIVDGVKIQSKYCKSAQSSVDSAFKGSKGVYKYLDNNGKPMQLEVPKDQYDKAIELMELKIKKGQVPGISDPNEAKNIVRKGNVTYQEAKNYTKFCTKESLKFDAMNGTVVAIGAFGVSYVINVTALYLKEGDLKKALKQSAFTSMQVGAQAFITYIASTQLQRIPQINAFLQNTINFSFTSKFGQTFAKSVGKPVNISSATAANNAIRSTVVVAVATMAVTSSLDVIKMMKNEISGMQCVKNIVVNAGGIAGGSAGALIGATIGSVVPVVGTFVGGVLGGLIGGFGGGTLSKKIMDNFIEDDIVKKQRVFFFQMLYLATLFRLTQIEARIFKEKVDELILESEDFFGKTFNANNMQSYANSVLKPIIVEIIAQRTMITKKALDEDIIEAIIIEEVEQSA
nr:hypothetical protein [Campylobacter sp.]